MSQDIVEVKCAVLLRRQAFSHQIEDVEAVLARRQVDQTRLLQHVGVHAGLNIRRVLYFNKRCVNYISTAGDSGAEHSICGLCSMVGAH